MTVTQPSSGLHTPRGLGISQVAARVTVGPALSDTVPVATGALEQSLIVNPASAGTPPANWVCFRET